ncbi:MAG: hypothetical protein U0359_03505 [Byssovorax sp.]
MIARGHCEDRERAPRRVAGQACAFLGAAALSIVIAGGAQAGPARPRTARLAYVLAPGTQGCPAEQVFRMSVRAQADRDLLVPAAPARLRIEIERRAKDRLYEATVDLYGETGEVLAHRSITPLARCLDVVQAAAVVVAELLDPIEPVVAPPPPSPAPARLPEAPPQAQPPPEERAVSFQAGLGSRLGLGIAPRPAGGLSGDAGIRWSALSVSAELRWDPPASAEVGGARLSTFRIMGGVVPCGHWSRKEWGLFGCAVAQAGEIWGEAEGVPGAGSTGAPLVAVGGRLGGEVWLTPVTPHLGLRLSGDLMGQVLGGTFVLGPRAVWAMPRLTGDVGLGAVARW